MHITPTKLKQLLVKSKAVDEKTFATAESESQRLNQPVVDVLVGRRDITEEYLAELLEPYFGTPIVNLEKVTIPEAVLELVAEAYAKANNVVSYEYDKKNQVIKVAMTDPLNLPVIEYLRAKLQVWVEPALTTSGSLKHGLKQYKKIIGEKFSQVISENVQKFISESVANDVTKLIEDIPIVTILNSIIEHAVVLGASDIHFEPLNHALLVRFRIDGILHEVLSLHKAVEPILVARVKILANLQIDEHRMPQDGRFEFGLEEGESVDVRVNVMPVIHGEKVEMRLLKGSSRPLSLSELGMAGPSVQVVEEEVKKPHGMILATGPTGHGKTTTLYAILHLLNTPAVNIVTIEDPIEYDIPRINQTQVNQKAGITFANGLRSLLRQNPDIIMVGEIRDNETVEIAIHSALTGHLVLSTLHTNDAPSALPRFLDMGAPAYLLSSTVNIVIAQRLVRKICQTCVSSYKMTPDIKNLITAQMKHLGETHIQTTPDLLFIGKGCQVCGGSGYQGQVGIFEILKVTEPIRQLVLKSAPVTDIKRQAITEGLVTMFEDGLQKVEQGITTIEEVIRVVRE